MLPSTLFRFSQACGAGHPLDLTVERENGTVIANGLISQPFAVIGRDSGCDLVVTESEIAPRHLAVQVVDGRLFAVDLSGKVGGLTVGGVPRQDAWVSNDDAVRIGPYRLKLGMSVGMTTQPSTFHPLVPDPVIVSQFPKATIEFRNGRTAQSRWDVNRVMTFVGRAKACKINLSSEDVSLYHCYLLLTSDGLWVVDALGRGGIAVDGVPVRFARLSPKDDLRVARFHLGCSYPNGEPSDSIIPLASAKSPAGSATPPLRPVPDPGPTAQTHSLRPGSGTTAFPAVAPMPVFDPPSPEVEMPKDLVLPAATSPSRGDDLVPARVLEQFQQSMLTMMKMFGQMQQQQMAGIQKEMARLVTLTEELHKMQSAAAPTALPRHHNPLPAPDDLPSVNEETADQHQYVFDRIAQMEAERQTIWKRLAGMIGPKPASA